MCMGIMDILQITLLTCLSNNVYKHYEWAYEIYRILPKELYGLSAQEVQEVFLPTAVMCAVFHHAYLILDYGMLILSSFDVYKNSKTFMQNGIARTTNFCVCYNTTLMPLIEKTMIKNIKFNYSKC